MLYQSGFWCVAQRTNDLVSTIPSGASFNPLLPPRALEGPGRTKAKNFEGLVRPSGLPQRCPLVSRLARRCAQVTGEEFVGGSSELGSSTM